MAATRRASRLASLPSSVPPGPDTRGRSGRSWTAVVLSLAVVVMAGLLPRPQTPSRSDADPRPAATHPEQAIRRSPASFPTPSLHPADTPAAAARWTRAPAWAEPDRLPVVRLPYASGSRARLRH